MFSYFSSVSSIWRGHSHDFEYSATSQCYSDTVFLLNINDYTCCQLPASAEILFQAFELAHVGGGGPEGEESSHAYIWTSTSIIGGVYLFFLIERFMRMINVWREVVWLLVDLSS